MNKVMIMFIRSMLIKWTVIILLNKLTSFIQSSESSLQLDFLAADACRLEKAMIYLT